MVKENLLKHEKFSKYYDHDCRCRRSLILMTLLFLCNCKRLALDEVGPPLTVKRSKQLLSYSKFKQEFKQA